MTWGNENMERMTTIIMNTSDDNRMWSFLALFQGFPFLGNLPITLVFHEAPTGTRKKSGNTANRDSKRLPFPGAVADIARIKHFHRWPQVLILRFPGDPRLRGPVIGL